MDMDKITIRGYVKHISGGYKTKKGKSYRRVVVSGYEPRIDYVIDVFGDLSSEKIKKMNVFSGVIVSQYSDGTDRYIWYAREENTQTYSNKSKDISISQAKSIALDYACKICGVASDVGEVISVANRLLSWMSDASSDGEAVQQDRGNMTEPEKSVEEEEENIEF